MLLTTHKSGERFFGFPFQTDRRRRWLQAQQSGGTPFRQLCPTYPSNRRKVRAGHFSEASPELISGDVHPYGSTALFGDFRAQKTRSEGIHSLQVSQNELAEPFKYSNTVYTSSTTVCCIPFMTADAVANRSRGERESLTFVRDFTGGLRRRKRLSLLKEFAASTLGTFQKECITRKHARPMVDHEGGEGG
jgi:hypothetical protein